MGKLPKEKKKEKIALLEKREEAGEESPRGAILLLNIKRTQKIIFYL